MKKEANRSKVKAQERVEEAYFKKEANMKQITNDHAASGSTNSKILGLEEMMLNQYSSNPSTTKGLVDVKDEQEQMNRFTSLLSKDNKEVGRYFPDVR